MDVREKLRPSRPRGKCIAVHEKLRPSRPNMSLDLASMVK